MLFRSPKEDIPWQQFPALRPTLARWKLIPEGSPESAVGELGLSVRKVIASSDDPVDACLDFLARHPTDLVVLSVHQHNGRMRWMERAVGKPIARAIGEMTLYLPHGMDGFVAPADGAVTLRHILVPVTDSPLPAPAVSATARLIRNLGLPAGKVTLLHVGAPDDAPPLTLPGDTGWEWARTTRSGDPASTIAQFANETQADLIVMTSEGPHGFLDALRGSTSERVLSMTHCPLLNLPVGSRHG